MQQGSEWQGQGKQRHWGGGTPRVPRARQVSEGAWKERGQGPQGPDHAGHVGSQRDFDFHRE